MARRHARAETMGTLAASSVGLVGPFHDKAPCKSGGISPGPWADGKEGWLPSGRGSIAAAYWPVKPATVSLRPCSAAGGLARAEGRADRGREISARFPRGIFFAATTGARAVWIRRSKPIDVTVLPRAARFAVVEPGSTHIGLDRRRPPRRGLACAFQRDFQNGRVPGKSLGKPTCEHGITESRLGRRQYETLGIRPENYPMIPGGSTESAGWPVIRNFRRQLEWDPKP